MKLLKQLEYLESNINIIYGITLLEYEDKFYLQLDNASNNKQMQIKLENCKRIIKELKQIKDK